jgi:hypothetical protein
MSMRVETAIAVVREDESFEVQYSLGGFLAGYSGNTRDAYQQDLRTFIGWCQIQQVEVFRVRRTHIELFARWLEQRGAARPTVARRLSTVAGFYRYCVEEELLTLNPASNVRRPKLRPNPQSRGLIATNLVCFSSRPVWLVAETMPWPAFWPLTVSEYQKH